jgi:hypothetical protein
MELSTMANQITVNSGTGNITVTTSRAVIGTVANVASANFANFAGEVVDSSQPNITSVGTLSNLNVANTITTVDLVVTGNFSVGNLVANNANFANFAGEVVDASQPNITSVGILNGLVVSGNITPNANITYNLGNNTNRFNDLYLANSTIYLGAQQISANATSVNFSQDVSITGNLQIGNLVANSANFANFAGVANVANTVAGANVTGTVANATFATSAGSANTANSATIAASANAVAGANVSGEVANANYASFANIANSANSVAVANVSGIGNIATVNLDGNASNVLFGNGTFGPEGSTGNANYANFAGTAFSVSGSNVSGTVANATYADNAGNANTANSATVAGSANSVAVGNVSGIGNIATVNLDGNASNILYGNGSFAAPAIISNVANANYANFAGTAFSVSGSNVSGEVANANFASYSNVANSANAVAGANVSGTVANATFALDAGNANVANTANSVAVANVSGIGNIATVNLDGSSSNVLFGNGIFAPESTSIANANYANFAGDVVNSSQSNITSLGNLVSLQVGTGTDDTLRFVPAGSNLTTSASNITVAQTRITTATAPTDATVLSANTQGTTYTQQFVVPDGSNVATMGSIIYNVDTTLGSGNAAVQGSITQRLFSSNSDLTTGSDALSTDLVLTASSILYNQKIPSTGAGAGLIQTISYGEAANAAASVGLRFQRRRGNNNTRLSLEPNDYVGNIEWRPGRGGNPFGTTAKFGAKVDGGYTANSNPVPIGMEMTVVNSSNTQLSHSFYANGDVNFTNTVNATNFTGNGSGLTNLQPTQIINGNSNASFTGAGGDLNITIDNNQYATFFSNRKLQLSGIEADSGNASQLVLDNGGLVLVQEDLGGGFASFDFKSYFSTGFIAPYTFYRARGNISSPNNVQSGDAITTQSYLAYGDSGNTFVNVGTYSATVTANDGAGNVQSRIEIATNRNDNGSEVKLYADKVVLQGNTAIELNAPTNMGSGSLFKLASFTASALNAITGSIGQMAAVSNSAGGGNPNGMIAFWDTTNARWSYIHDNSAV